MLRVSQCVLEQTNEVFPICNVSADYRRSSRGDVCSNRTAMSLDFRNPRADEDFALKRVCRFISRLMLGHRFGGYSGARRHLVFCFALRAPLGLGSSQNKFASGAENALQTCLGSLPESRPSALGSRAHSPASLNVTRATTGEFKKRRRPHISEQSHAHRFSRQQRRSSQQRQLHNSLAGNQVLLQKERRVYLTHGMAPLRGVRQALGVRQNAH